MQVDAPGKPDAYRAIFRSSVGCKLAMAATGIPLLLFVIGHLLGNLLFFRGSEALNAYAAALKGMPAILWGSRLFLSACLAVHVAAAAVLACRNRAARPAPYACEETLVASYASRTMMMSGLVVLAFVCFHLAHLTIGWVHPGFFQRHDAQGRHDVYAMVVLGFRDVRVSALYAGAMGLLAMHLGHGASSLFQTLGLRFPALAPVLDRLGPALAAAVFLGYASIPLSVLAGIAGRGVVP